MPRITQYFSNSQAAGSVPNPRVSPVNFGASTAQYAQAFGNSVSALGDTATGVVNQYQQQEKIRQKQTEIYEKEKGKIEDLRFSTQAVNTLKDYESTQLQRVNEENSLNFSQFEEKNFNELVEKTVGEYNFKDPVSEMKFTNDLYGVKRKVLSKAMKIESDFIVSDTRRSLGEYADSLGSGVAANNISLEQATAELAEQIELSSSTLPIDGRDKFEAGLIKKMHSRFLSNLVVNDPYAAEEFLSSEEGAVFDPSLREGFYKESQRTIDRIERLEDKNEDLRSEQVVTDLMVKAVEGTLTVAEVNAYRTDLRDKLPTLMKIAKESSPTSDGRLRSNIITKMLDGENMEDQILAARDDNLLSNDDFVNLYSQNSSIQKSGFSNPIDAGRKYIKDSLGASSDLIDTMGSVVIGNASFEYESAVLDFQQKKGRSPNKSEVADLANKIINEYSIFDKDSVIQALPKPVEMDIKYKQNPSLLSEDIIEDINKRTFRKFYDKHQGDKAAISSDPEFLKEKKKINNIISAIQQQQKKVK